MPVASSQIEVRRMAGSRALILALALAAAVGGCQAGPSASDNAF
jgi:hypothetical protein